ncbi:hypothetical protein J6590_000869 [Homalodisca vitripennis]|nr:hypothetical protein J6590_000869 [Homalodisca vitripennis]
MIQVLISFFHLQTAERGNPLNSENTGALQLWGIIVLALVAVAHSDVIIPLNYFTPTITSDGYLADTPEVAAAKAAHLTELAKASVASGPAPNTGNDLPFHQQALPLVTSEIIAKATPLNEYVPPVVVPAFNYPQYYKLNPQYLVGSSAVTPEGFLVDTSEVAAAKSAHYAEHANAIAAAGLSPDHLYQEYHNTFRTSQFYQDAISAPVATPVTTPIKSSVPADVLVTPEGFIAETPEVAEAKRAHLAEFAKTLKRA